MITGIGADIAFISVNQFWVRVFVCRLTPAGKFDIGVVLVPGILGRGREGERRRRVLFVLMQQQFGHL